MILVHLTLLTFGIVLLVFGIQLFKMDKHEFEEKRKEYLKEIKFLRRFNMLGRK